MSRVFESVTKAMFASLPFLTLSLFIALTGAPSAFSAGPEELELPAQHCESALAPQSDSALSPRSSAATFEKVLLAAEKYEDELLVTDNAHLETAMNELGMTSPEERQAFAGAIKLKPLFDSGIAYEAIAAETIIRGYSNKKDAASVIRNFALLPVSEKRSIIDGILDNIIFALEVNIDLSNITSLPKRAARFKMSEAELSRFLKRWRQLESSDFEEAKFVLLDLLRTPSTSLIENVLIARKNFIGFNWFRKRLPLRPLFSAEKDGTFDTTKLLKYFRGTHFALQHRFLRNHWSDLTPSQQLTLIRDGNLWSHLPDDLLAAIQERHDVLKKRETLISKTTTLRDKLAFVQKALDEQLLQISASEQPSTVNVDYVVRIFEATQGNSDWNATLKTIDAELNEYEARLNSSDYLKVAQTILDLAERKFIKFGDTSAVLHLVLRDRQAELMKEKDFLELALRVLRSTDELRSLESIRAVTKSVVHKVKFRGKISTEAEKAIKKEIAERISTRSQDAAWVKSIFALIENPLTDKTKKYRDPESLRSEIDSIKAQIDEAEKELAKLD